MRTINSAAGAELSTIQERACGGSGPPRAAPTPLLGQPLPWSPTPGPAKAAVSWGRECLWSRSCRREEAGSGGRDWHTKELISNERLPPASRIRSPDSTSPGTAGATSIHSQAKRDAHGRAEVVIRGSECHPSQAPMALACPGLGSCHWPVLLEEAVLCPH